MIPIIHGHATEDTPVSVSRSTNSGRVVIRVGSVNLSVSEDQAVMLAASLVAETTGRTV